MLTSNLRKTVLAVAALALCPSLAFAHAGSEPAKPMTTTTMSTPAVAPAANVKATKTVVKAKTHKTTRVSQLAKHKHLSKVARVKTKTAKTASLSTSDTMKAKTAAK
jgi:hypothetical protein